MKLFAQIRKQQAFTLIELLIVLVILSILASLVLPGYRSITLKTQRAEGQALMQEVQAQLERYYFHHQRYPENLSHLRHYAEDTVESQNAYFKVNLSEVSSSCPATSCYLLVATHSSGDQKETLSISSTGDKQGPW